MPRIRARDIFPRGYMSRVVIGLSGGVDSSVAAHILKQQGHEVIGLFMRNWKEEEGGHCTADIDFGDVMRVAERLDIPYYTVDLSEQYEKKVFAHFVEEYKKGRTPNPDVLCNREIKFGDFARFAKKLGADYIATGHYAGISHESDGHYLLRAKDENKDQTYFLNQVSQAQLQNVLFPLGEMTKPEVRAVAADLGLATADKKDSTGICFIGERNFREFLSQYIPMKAGDIVCDGRVVGQHKGVYFYTLGQRKGLGIGGEGERWFVTGKDVEKNVLYVSHGEDDCLFKSRLVTEGFNFINGTPTWREKDVLVRIRHREPLKEARIKILESGDTEIVFKNPERAIAEGQYAVAYDGRICLGGGVIGCACDN